MDSLELVATTVNDLAADPSRLWLFVGPVTLILVLLLAIFTLKLVNRRRDHAVLSQVAREDAPSLPTVDASAEISVELAEVKNLKTQSWLNRLSEGLKRTRENLSSNLSALFVGKTTLTDEIKEKLHEGLFRADLGVTTAKKLVNFVEKDSAGQDIDWEDVKSILKKRVGEILSATQKPVNIPPQAPYVLLVVGVNGVGKTTSVAKLAASFLAQDKSVLLCAADTFRAAAIDQLKVWGERLDVDVIAHQQGSDPAAVAYDGVKAAIARKVDVLIIDTAGRLHSKKELMDELGKINRVVGRDLPGAPHDTWLVVDATTGQNALMQIRAFSEVVKLTGLVVTKLDGTAKGGVLVAASDQFGLPIQYIGVGEKAADLRPFVAEQYADSLL